MTPPFEDTDFRKASGSGTRDCVEAAITEHTPDLVGLRDSKNPHDGVLSFALVEWLAFTTGTR